MDLIEAVDANDLPRVRLLVGQGYEKERCNNGGFTALRLACHKGYLGIVKYLVEQGARLENENEDGWTPLFCAINNNHYWTVSYLLQQGANSDKVASGFLGFTPLHLAVSINDLAITQLLMISGVDMTARDTAGNMPVIYARTEQMKQAFHNELERRRGELRYERLIVPGSSINASTTMHQDHEEDERRFGHHGTEERKVADEDIDTDLSDDRTL